MSMYRTSLGGRSGPIEPALIDASSSARIRKKSTSLCFSPARTSILIVPREIAPPWEILFLSGFDAIALPCRFVLPHPHCANAQRRRIDASLGHHTLLYHSHSQPHCPTQSGYDRRIKASRAEGEPNLSSAGAEGAVVRIAGAAGGSAGAQGCALQKGCRLL